MSWGADEQREVDGRQVEQALPEMVQRVVREARDVGGGLAGERRDVAARELVGGGSALLAAAAFDLAT